jgi:uncharacterized phage-associated protein
MAAWSPQIANEFIRRAKADSRALTQMQLQKLVYIAHGWTLAITERPLTHDEPEAWEYGPVYKELRRALRSYGSDGVSREIKNGEFSSGVFARDDDAVAVATLTPDETQIVQRVYSDYSQFHAFQLSALTHKSGTPWTIIYADGNGKYNEIPSSLIRDHFVELAHVNRTHHAG